MIGNDVVDRELAASQSNWKRRGYLQKLFTPAEQALVWGANDPGVLVWVLWTMKESAYKAHQRRFNLPRTYRPTDFNCDITHILKNEASGKVRIGEYSYPSKSSITADYIHSTATGLPQEKLVTKLFRSSEDITGKLIDEIPRAIHIKNQYIRIKKNTHGIPRLLCKEQDLSIAFSLSYHGNFSAFALPLMNY